ncbi:MAG: hypothetical protein EU530_07210 [Promethearchaeota archaeon]|nr:MAG: hypothetical protein EU530_07210 [Candidatus Lokiarchaeota archaeon]
MNLEEALVELKKEPIMSLATCVNNQPYVRIMALISYNNKFYCVTSKSRPKTKQIQSNPKYSFVVKLTGNKDIGSIRVRGVSEIITVPNEREEVGGSISWFKQFWKSFEDPEFVLVRLHVYEILTHDPDSKERINFENLDL